MRKKWIFILVLFVGIVVGAFLSDLYHYNKTNKNYESEVIDSVLNDDVITGSEGSSIFDTYNRSEAFKEQGQLISEKSFKVFQVLLPGQALVNGKDEYGYYNGVVYLLLDNISSDFYDEQIINVPKGKVAKRLRTYKYVTNNGRYKTVPMIMIVDKD